MKRAGRGFRLTAILLGAVAGVIPILGELITSGGEPVIKPLWSAIAVALAATLVLLDKFYGCTSAWVRYLLAELELQELLKGFCLDWESARLGAGQPEPTPEQAAAMILNCRKLLIQAHGVVRDETQKWAAEFQSLLRQLEEATKAAGQARALGALSVTVTNGPDCAQGWQLTIDGGNSRLCRGRECAVADIQPGIRVVRVTGTLANREAQAEKAVQVSAGDIAKVELTLA